MVTMGSVWDRATEFLGDNIRAITPFALAVFVCASLQDNLTQVAGGAVGSGELLIRLIMLAITLVALLARMGVIALAVDDRQTTAEAFGTAARRYLPMLLVLIELSLLFFVAVIPIGGVMAANGITMTQLQGNNLAPVLDTLPTGARLFVSVYILAIALIAIWFAARQVILMAVVVAEGGIFRPIYRSFRLTSGLALRIIGVIILLTVVTLVAATATRIVFGTVLGLLIGDSGPLSLTAVLTSIAVAIVSTLLTLITDAFFTKLYLAGRAASEGVDPE